eukprot:14509741-Alexandrium_andersonii.AAC.1
MKTDRITTCVQLMLASILLEGTPSSTVLSDDPNARLKDGARFQSVCFLSFARGETFAPRRYIRALAPSRVQTGNWQSMLA